MLSAGSLLIDIYLVTLTNAHISFSLGSAIFRLLPYLVSPFIPYATTALKQIAPVLFEKVFGT